MAKQTMVEMLRHSLKDTGKRNHMLSVEGLELAMQTGYEKGSAYTGYDSTIVKGSDFQARDGYIGRAAESAMLLGVGARWNVDISNVVDKRLGPDYSDASVKLYKTIVADGGRPELDFVLATADESFKSAYKTAQFIDAYAKQNEGTVTIGVTHSTTIVALTYLLTKGNSEIASIPISEMKGFRISYDKGNDTYTVILDYTGGQKIEIKGESIAEAVKAAADSELSKMKSKDDKKKTVNLDDIVAENDGSTELNSGQSSSNESSKTSESSGSASGSSSDGSSSSE